MQRQAEGDLQVIPACCMNPEALLGLGELLFLEHCYCKTMMRKKKNILIVEDNKDMQLIYSDILSGIYNLYIAGDAEHAKSILENEEIDLMVLDIILPRERGDSFFTMIKLKPEHRDLKTICISVHEDMIQSLKQIDPCAGFLAKPFSRRELLEMIEELLQRDTQI